jgi:hypothetical protein
MNDAATPKPIRPMRKRDRLRRIREAEEAIVSCQGAIDRSPDQLGRDTFARSQRVWQKRLAKLNL